MRAHIHGRGKCFQLVHTVLKLLSADKVNWMAVYCSSPLPKDIRRNNQIAFKVPLSQSLSLLVSSCSCQQNWGKANFKLIHVAYRIAEKKSDSCINREREGCTTSHGHLATELKPIIIAHLSEKGKWKRFERANLPNWNFTTLQIFLCIAQTHGTLW